MAAKIVHQMKEKMLLAGQSALLAEMIPKREGALTMPSVSSLGPGPVPASRASQGSTSGDNHSTSNLHLPLALRKQRRPNAGFKPKPRQEVKKKKRANTVQQLKEELRLQLEKKRAAAAANAQREEAQQKAAAAAKSTPKKKLKRPHPDHVESFHKKKKIRPILRDGNTNNDSYCWICHREDGQLLCQACPRIFHDHCISEYKQSTSMWFCPECDKITTAECIDTQSASLAALSDEDLATLLQSALNRMKHSGSGPFMFPVSMETAPNYLSYVFNPMDLSTLEKNIRTHMYGSPEAFLADVKWIVHNCTIYNGSASKLAKNAELIVEIAEHEIKEIQICADCVRWSSSKKKNWFCEPCRKVHTLVWAKLKGFPYWPAKVLRDEENRLDVRFFGQHDRAWVQVQDCYRISKEMPFPPTNNKTHGLNHAFREVEIHMNRLRDKRIKCQYAPIRTPYDQNRTYAHRVTPPPPIPQVKPTASRGRKRKKKGKNTTVKKVYVPVLRDLEPLSYDSDEAIDPEKEIVPPSSSNQEAVVKQELDGSAEKPLAASPEQRETRDHAEVETEIDVDGSTNPTPKEEGESVTQTPKTDALPPSAEKDDKSVGTGETPTGDTPASRFNVSRKVYSRSGKFLSLASNITEEARSVVDWSPTDDEGPPTRKSVEGKDSGPSPSKDPVEAKVHSVPEIQIHKSDDTMPNNMSNNSEQELTDGVAAGRKSGVVEQSDAATEDIPGVSGEATATSSKSVSVPVVLPNKLPDPHAIMVKSEDTAAPSTASSGTQVTPQKNDKFNEKLNQTIRSCRKFLGLQSETAERGAVSDDESIVRSELESASSQDGSDDDESRPSRQVTPSSVMGGTSPRSGRSSRKPSIDFSSDSDDNDNEDLKLVIDGEILKGEIDKGKRDKPVEPLSSPKLMIKMPFGPRGKQKTMDAESSLGDDDDDFDGDKEMQDVRIDRVIDDTAETDEETRDTTAEENNEEMGLTDARDSKDGESVKAKSGDSKQDNDERDIAKNQGENGKVDSGPGNVESGDKSQEEFKPGRMDASPGMSEPSDKQQDKDERDISKDQSKDGKMDTSPGNESEDKPNKRMESDDQIKDVRMDASPGIGEPGDKQQDKDRRVEFKDQNKDWKMEESSSQGKLDKKDIEEKGDISRKESENNVELDDIPGSKQSTEIVEDKEIKDIVGRERSARATEVEILPGEIGFTGSGVETESDGCDFIEIVPNMSFTEARKKTIVEETVDVIKVQLQTDDKRLERSKTPSERGEKEVEDMEVDSGESSSDKSTSSGSSEISGTRKENDQERKAESETGQEEPGDHKNGQEMGERTGTSVSSGKPRCEVTKEECKDVKMEIDKHAVALESKEEQVCKSEGFSAVVKETLDEMVQSVEAKQNSDGAEQICRSENLSLDVKKTVDGLVELVEIGLDGVSVKLEKDDVSRSAKEAIEDALAVNKTVEDMVERVVKEVDDKVCAKDNVEASGICGRPEYVSQPETESETTSIIEEALQCIVSKVEKDLNEDIVGEDEDKEGHSTAVERDNSNVPTGNYSRMVQTGVTESIDLSETMKVTNSVSGEEDVTIVDEDMEVDRTVTPMLGGVAVTPSLGGVTITPRARVGLTGASSDLPDESTLTVEDMDVTEITPAMTSEEPMEVMATNEQKEKAGVEDPSEGTVDPVVRDVLLSICIKIQEAVGGSTVSQEVSGWPSTSNSQSAAGPAVALVDNAVNWNEASHVEGLAEYQQAVIPPVPPISPTDRKYSELCEELQQLRKKNMIEQQARIERKATYELMVLEIFENYQIILEDKVAKMTKEHETQLLEAKRKQWCAYCQKEAVFFCCWNTSYCDYPCQQKHWALHQRVCQQATNAAASNPGPSTVTTTAPGPAHSINNPPPQTGSVAGPSSMTNLIQYVKFMPPAPNDPQSLQGRSPTMVPSQMPASSMALGPPVHASQPMVSAQIPGAHMQPTRLPGVGMQTGPMQQVMAQQLRPTGPVSSIRPLAQMGPYTQGGQVVNFQQQGNMVRQRMPNGNEVLLHIPQGMRM